MTALDNVQSSTLLASSSSLSAEGPEAMFRKLRLTAKNYKQHAQAAQLAWRIYQRNSSQVYIPRREHYVLEWLVDRLLKTKDEGRNGPLLQLQYWKLFLSLVQDAAVQTRYGQLQQTLQKTPTLPILTALVQYVPELLKEDVSSDDSSRRKGKAKAAEGETAHVVELLETVHQVYAMLLPSLSGSTITDQLLASLSSWLSHTTSFIESVDTSDNVACSSWISIASLLTTTLQSFIKADKNAARKLHTFILSHTNFSKAVMALQTMETSSPASAQLSAAVRQIFSVSLFSYQNLSRTLQPALLPSSTLEQLSSTQLLREISAAVAANVATAGNNVLLLLPLLTDELDKALQKYGLDLLQKNVRTNAAPMSTSAAETTALTFRRNATFSFLSMTLDVIVPLAASVDAARLVLHLVNHIEQKKLYTAAAGENSKSWMNVLCKTVQYLVDLYVASRSTEAVEAMTTVARLDFSAVEPALPDIMRAVSTDRHSSIGESFMQEAISYAARLRNLPTLVGQIADAFSSPLADQKLPSLRSSIISLPTRQLLAKECVDSLSADQAMSLVITLLERMQQIITNGFGQRETGGFEAEQSPKKRKTGKDSHIASLDVGVENGDESAVGLSKPAGSAVYFQALASLAIVILQAEIEVSEHQTETVCTAVNELCNIGLSILLSIHTASDNQQIQAAACLQLALACRNFGKINLPPITQLNAALNEVLPATKRKKTSSKTILPCLTVQIIHTLLELDAPPMDDIFRIVSAGLRIQPAAVWDGYTDDISRSHLCIAIWYILTVRYLPLVETASPEHLEDFVKLFFATVITTKDGDVTEQGLTLANITRLSLRSAAFYEYVRIRSYVMAYIDKHEDPQDLLNEMVLVPRDYVDKSIRRKVALRLGQSDKNNPLTDGLLLAWTRDDVGSPLSLDLAYLQKLALRQESSSGAGQLFEQLLQLLFQSWNASPTKYGDLQVLISGISPGGSNTAIDLFSVDQSKGMPHNSAILKMVSVLIEESKPASLPEALLAFLAQQVQMVHTEVRNLVARYEDKGSSPQASTLHSLIAVQKLRQWLGSAVAIKASPDTLAHLAVTLLQVAVRGEADPEQSYLILELASLNVSDHGLISFEVFVAAAVFVRQHLSSSDKVDKVLERTTYRQSIISYDAALQALISAISISTPEHVLSAALDSLSILVGSHPSESARSAAHAITTSTKRLLLCDVQHCTKSIVSSVIRFIRSICSHKITSLEVHDVGTIFTLIVKICGPSSPDVHSTLQTKATIGDIYLGMVDILSMLSLQRRDLLVPIFPQFCTALLALIRLLRLPAPGTIPAAAKEHTSASFPAWASISINDDGISNVHGKALARLLSSLDTKAVISRQTRSAPSRDGSRKDAGGQSLQVSLLGPLSKHAPFLMVGYLRAATDARTPLSVSLRKELQPGIMTILGSMGKYERESLMRGFLTDDMEAERVLLRAMWTTYDKIRYKGN